MKYGKKLLIVFVALAVIGSAVRASAPAVVSVGVGDQYYNEGNVATLLSFADMLFKTTPEAIFPQLSAGSVAPNINDTHMGQLLAEGSPMRGMLLRPEMVLAEFDAYFKTFKRTVRADTEWVPGAQVEDFVEFLGILKKENRGIARHELRNYRFVKKTVIRSAEQESQRVFCIGDIHGSVHSLLRDLLLLFEHQYLRDDFTLAPNTHLIFLGDYTDRGLRGIEAIYTILRLKNKNWGQVHLVRGNHEDGLLIERYGFVAELTAKYNLGDKERILLACRNFYATLPVATFFGFHDNARQKMMYFLGCHGCMSPYFNAKTFLASDKKYELLADPKIVIPMTEGSFSASLLFEWGDVTGFAPAEKLRGYSSESFATSAVSVPAEWPLDGDRGLCLHYADLTKILAANDVLFTVRGHQDAHAPVKVCCDGEVDPMSVRGHPDFIRAGITPYNFFHQGVPLAHVPSCITTTTGVEAKLMAFEGFTWFELGNSIEESRWGGFDVNLTRLDDDKLASLVPSINIAEGVNFSLIDIPGEVMQYAASRGINADTKSNIEYYCSKRCPEYPLIKDLCDAILLRHNSFIYYEPFEWEQQRTDITLQTSVARFNTGCSAGVSPFIGTEAFNHITGEPIPVALGESLGAYIPPIPVADDSPTRVATAAIAASPDASDAVCMPSPRVLCEGPLTGGSGGVVRIQVVPATKQ